MKKRIHLLTTFFLAVLMIAGTMSAAARTPFVKVLQPNHANIQWALKTRHLISWDDNFTKPVNIDLVNYGVSPHTVYHLATNISGSTYSWYIYKDKNGYTIPKGNYFKIRISSVVDPTIKDESDKYFKIVLAPTIDVYPNPSTTQVTLKFNEKDNENYTVTLYNRYNMRIISRTVNTNYLKEIRINTFDLPNGIYFLRLTSARGVISKKIIVQH